MSGPPYPPPVPGSNSIGQFVVGVSSIGDIIPFNIWSTIISQYANSPILTSLLTNLDQYLDQTQNFASFYDNVFNIDTAQGAGLDVWGRRLNITRFVNVSTTAYFGFGDNGNAALADTFGQAPFYSFQALTMVFPLTDPAFRVLLYAKLFYNLSNGSIQSINAILRGLFPNRGNAYVQDNNNMTMNYIFKFPLQPVELGIVQSSGVLPKPVGVTATVIHP